MVGRIQLLRQCNAQQTAAKPKLIVLWTGLRSMTPEARHTAARCLEQSPSALPYVPVRPGQPANHQALRPCSCQDEEDHSRPTTPWVRSVISGVDLMRDARVGASSVLRLAVGCCLLVVTVGVWTPCEMRGWVHHCVCLAGSVFGR